jgi:hypothetical protein
VAGSPRRLELEQAFPGTPTVVTEYVVIAEPFVIGFDHATVALPSPTRTDTGIGDPGIPKGTTEGVARDAAEEPFGLIAATVNE